MLQCVAVCCSVLQCVALCCSELQCVAVCCSELQCVAVCCSVLQCVAVRCSAFDSSLYLSVCLFQRVAVCCSVADPFLCVHIIGAQTHYPIVCICVCVCVCMCLTIFMRMCTALVLYLCTKYLYTNSRAHPFVVHMHSYSSNAFEKRQTTVYANMSAGK